LDDQVATLVARGYPELAGLSDSAFADMIEPLREASADAGRFVLVVKSELAPAAETIERVERRGKTGFSVLERDELERFAPIEEVELPLGPAYLLTAPDTGAETRNVTPDDALATIRGAGRSPLTVDEGIALVTHDPEAVAKNGGFSLLASRCGDRRVTALWISDSRPKLGWCWAGNPHTWLGSASCAGRIGDAP
jgi:Family of unknown function (DUF5701)